MHSSVVQFHSQDLQPVCCLQCFDVFVILNGKIELKTQQKKSHNATETNRNAMKFKKQIYIHNTMESSQHNGNSPDHQILDWSAKTGNCLLSHKEKINVSIKQLSRCLLNCGQVKNFTTQVYFPVHMYENCCPFLQTSSPW